MSLVLAKLYYHQNHAQVMKSSLAAAGIPSFIFNRQVNSIWPSISVGLGGMQLMVCESDFEEVQAFIAMHDKAATEVESETEAFRRLWPVGILGVILSIFCSWLPFWTRYRKYKRL